MDNRKYNIYFNTHTVSGIIICAILYVIFFAGSFTFFKDDIAAWQKNEFHPPGAKSVKKDFNYLIDSLGKKHQLRGRDFDFTMLRSQTGTYVSMSASHDSTMKKQSRNRGLGRNGRGGRQSRQSDRQQQKSVNVKLQADSSLRIGRVAVNAVHNDRHGRRGQSLPTADSATSRRSWPGRRQFNHRNNDTSFLSNVDSTHQQNKAGRHHGGGVVHKLKANGPAITASIDTTSTERRWSRGDHQRKHSANFSASSEGDTMHATRGTVRRNQRNNDHVSGYASKHLPGDSINAGNRRQRQNAVKKTNRLIANAGTTKRIQTHEDHHVRDGSDGEKEGKKEKRRGRGRRGDGDNAFFTYDFTQHKEADYTSGYTMGEFLYRLHFLAQVNQILPFRIGVPFGYLLAGIVSFIFLFALITGLLLHWDKLVRNFFVFRPWNKWKNVWTELHTVLGVIGFPYQLVFAITGIVLIFNSFLIVPYTKLFYKGNQEKIYKDLGYGIKAEYAYSYHPLDKTVDIDSLVKVVENQWNKSELTTIAIRNFGDANMHVIIQGKPSTAAQMNGLGEWIYRVRDQRVVENISPLAAAGYLSTVKGLIYHLHFGDFGGRPLKVIYFVLGILGCIVINSGIMIWLVARDKNNIPERKRKFNFSVANVYLASSLSLLPVTGLTMIALLFLHEPGQSDIYHWFFYSWLILGVYLLARRDLDLINRQTMLLSSVICILLPIIDGIKRGNWFWITYQEGANQILFIDTLFFVLGILSGVIYWKMKYKKRPAAIAEAAANNISQAKVLIN